MSGARCDHWEGELRLFRARVDELRRESVIFDGEVFPRAFLDSLEDVVVRFERRVGLEREKNFPVGGSIGVKRKEA